MKQAIGNTNTHTTLVKTEGGLDLSSTQYIISEDLESDVISSIRQSKAFFWNIMELQFFRFQLQINYNKRSFQPRKKVTANWNPKLL
jgi:hypothetical protein